MRPLPTVAAASVVLVACGSPGSAELPPAAGVEIGTTMPCSSPEDLDAIRSVVQAGLPTYDDEPAESLAELTGWVDAVVAGSLDRAVRSEVAIPGRTGMATVMSVSDVEVLAGSAEISEITASSVWASRGEPDPLGETVDFAGVGFVAYVAESEPSSGDWSPHVDGMVLGCVGSSLPAVPFIAVPPGMENLTIEEAIDAARVAAAGSDDAIDGPVVRHPEPQASPGGDEAEVRGVLELDGDCLYVALDEVGERYPVVWPAGTTWNEQSGAVSLPSSERLMPGADVYGGGGYSSVGAVERLVGPDAADALAACVDNEFGEIAVVNNSPDAIGAP